MDPLSAVSLAGNLIQFIQLGMQIVGNAKEIYVNGSVAANIDLEDLTKDLRTLTLKLKLPPRGYTASQTVNEQALNKAYDHCIEISDDLITHLKNLNGPGHRGKWKSFRQALETSWTKKDVERIASRLSAYRAQMELHLLVSLKEHQSITSLKQANDFKALERAVQEEVSRFFRIQIADAEDCILGSLRYPTMMERYEEITEAHRKTFEWIFRNPDGEKPWSDFSKWLQSQNGIYWINGKAASGKSCLMRYVFDDARTKKCLQEWSNHNEVTLAGFFFWNSGTTEQRSHKGLLRSLLYQLLGQQRKLIPILFPDLWKKVYLEPARYATSPGCFRRGGNLLANESWSLSKLSKLFKSLMDLSSSTKICIFIDGLDEYDGDCAEMIRLFNEVANLPNAKICISSRPWIIFEDAFRVSPGLRLQDLTYDDMKQFISDTLESHPKWVQLTKETPVQAGGLVEEIMSKANGVFLWVRLVVRSLTDGMTNHDDISDLQKRLRLLPADLERLYNHMLSRIDPPFYLEQASKIFQLVRMARELETLSKVNEEFRPKPLTVLQLSLAYEESIQDCTKWDGLMIEPQQLVRRSQSMADRLKTRCAGLLELGEPVKEPSMKGFGSWGTFPMKSVTYMHRTVRDFLEREDIWRMILGQTSSMDFSAGSRLLSSSVVWAKLLTELPQLELPEWQQQKFMSSDRWAIILHTMLQAYLEDVLARNSHSTALDQLDQTITLRNWSTSNPDVHWGKDLPFIHPTIPGELERGENSIISIAIEFGLYSYARCKILRDPKIISNISGRPLLHYAVCPFPFGIEYKTRTRIVKLLLEHGADPNESYPLVFGYNGHENWSPWQTALYWAYYGEGPKLAVWLELMTLFIHHGADPNAICDHNYTATQIVSELLRRAFPDRVEALELYVSCHGTREDSSTSADDIFSPLLGSPRPASHSSRASPETSVSWFWESIIKWITSCLGR
ncbi:uncharacterized protein BP5553_08481 [Venustampulla echinocandica]|uniref:NACHT domain-containing protein n=1 Tax=Venustampulla echinocandica TaxID=2656787 RepID=A0A370TEC3_9HELO|nr:uncharacterized protein BP5553_08481 [Venustampulla echinocandica]RDL33042.1 hypothetical protein BP5553_08481 [Venustampulla echinocandica]